MHQDEIRIRTIIRRAFSSLALTVLLTLAIGLGANTAMLTVDYVTLLAPLPYSQPERIILMVWSKIHIYHDGVAAGDFLDISGRDFLIR